MSILYYIHLCINKFLTTTQAFTRNCAENLKKKKVGDLWDKKLKRTCHHSRARRAALWSATDTSTLAVFVRRRWVGLSATVVARLSLAPLSMLCSFLVQEILARIFVCPLRREALATAASRVSNSLKTSSVIFGGLLARNASRQEAPLVTERIRFSIKCFTKRGRVAKSVAQIGQVWRRAW